MQGGLKKLIKTPLIYSVSNFNFRGIGALFGGLSQPKPPLAMGLYWPPAALVRKFHARLLTLSI